MKRFFLTMALLGTLLGVQAQDDSLGQQRVSLDLGLSVGVSLFNSDNEMSPYYSTHGLVLQVPLLLNYNPSTSWRLSTGLRVDLNYNPLHYNVDLHYTSDGNGYDYSDGLDFGNYAGSAYSDGKQHAYTFFGYIGIPLQATWYPWPNEHSLLGVRADLFAGYALSTNLGLKASYAERNGFSVGIHESGGVIHHAASLEPWKLELGITLSTDVLGLLHGVRFFVNLLPSYSDPLSGDGLYLHGMTFFL